MAATIAITGVLILGAAAIILLNWSLHEWE